MSPDEEFEKRFPRDENDMIKSFIHLDGDGARSDRICKEIDLK